MASLDPIELEVLTEGQVDKTVTAAGSYSLELDIDTVVKTSTVTTVEVAEVQLPAKIDFADTVKNVGNAPGLLVLNTADAVPPGTPAGTVILRK